MRTVTVTEARARFGSLLTAVERGEMVTITRRGVPAAVITPIHGQRPSLQGTEVAAPREDWSDRDDVDGPDLNEGS